MGISEQKIARIRQFSFQLSSSRFVSSRQLLSQRQKISLISTGAAELDGLLCGGIEPGAITELYGEFNTGKTQFCHTVACRAQLPRTRGGAEGRVLYIDTEGTFRPERIVDISNSLGIVSEECLDNIQVARAVSSEHQRELLKQAGELMAHDRYALIIVDSVTSLFRTDFNGRGQLADRQQRLGSFLRDLHSLATTYNVAVVITNQVVSDIAGAAMSNNGADNKKPIGGNILAHASTTRLQLKKGKGSTKQAKIVDSPLLPEGEAVFAICRGGLCDPVNDGQ
jgi:DNA repair protein RAD51